MALSRTNAFIITIRAARHPELLGERRADVIRTRSIRGTCAECGKVAPVAHYGYYLDGFNPAGHHIVTDERFCSLTCAHAYGYEID